MPNSPRQGFKLWVSFEVVLPLFLIMWIWPLSQFMMSIPNAYERIFSSADLLPFCSLMILGLYSDLSQNIKSGKLETLRLAALLGGIFLLVIYGSMKTLFMLSESGKLTAETLVDKILFSHFSMACLFLTLMFSFYTKSLS